MKKTILTMALFAFAILSSAQTQVVNQQVDCGSSFTLEAKPTDAGLYHFVKWSDGNTDNPRTFTDIQEALELTAIFTYNDLSVTFVVADPNIGEVQNVAGETVESLDIPYGESKTVKAVVKDDCYQFAGWFKVGEETPFDTKDELVVDGSQGIEIEARFVKKQFEVKVSLSEGSQNMGTVTFSKAETH